MTLKIAGQKFGRLLAIKDVGSKDKKRLWLFKCDCGSDFTCHAKDVVKGHTSSCGCLREERARASRMTDITGQRFGRLLAVKVAETGGGRVMWECQCDCGKTVKRSSKNLVNGTAKSCGCRKAEAGAENIENRKVCTIGMKFGKLTVVEEFQRGPRAKKMCRCQCDCGGEKTVAYSDLYVGKTISCGCQRGKKDCLMPQAARDYGAARGAMRRARIKGVGGKFTAKQVDDLYIKQRGRCAWCKKKLTKQQVIRDHREAIANGGDNTIHNIEILCFSCNSRKGAKDLIDWAQENGFLL